MKLKIFKSISKNGKAYWSFTGTNYKDKIDKITYFVRFTKCDEPKPINAVSNNGNSYSYADIDVEEMSFGCFNHTPQLSIFKYTQDETSVFDKETGNIDTSMMGGEKAKSGEYVDIKSEDLPFY